MNELNKKTPKEILQEYGKAYPSRYFILIFFSIFGLLHFSLYTVREFLKISLYLGFSDMIVISSAAFICALVELIVTRRGKDISGRGT